LAPAPPRLHLLVAAAAPVAVVFRRGPTRWAHLVRIELDTGGVEHGAWLRGRLFPRRSALSHDGRLLGYVAHTARRPPWDVYVAISRPPWLTALAAWHALSTYVEGCAFTADGAFAHGAREPIAGGYPHPVLPLQSVIPDDAPARIRWRLRDLQGEIRAGFRQLDEVATAVVLDATPVPAAHDVLVLARERPGDPSRRLAIVHAGHDPSLVAAEHAELHYLLLRGGEPELLEDVTCAAWDPRGRLVTTHADGTVRVRSFRGARERTEHQVDLTSLEPRPVAAPASAARPL
jgi:hypothetical protein